MAAYPTPGVYVMDNIPSGSPELTRQKLAGFVQILRDDNVGTHHQGHALHGHRLHAVGRLRLSRLAETLPEILWSACIRA